MKSIMQDSTGCYICGATITERHHVFKGCRRNLSEKYGLTVNLCLQHHRGTNGVHGKNGHDLDQKLREDGQRAFEREYPNLSFLKIFGKNYL